MTPLSAHFERGVNGNTIATSDAANHNPWDVVSIVSGGTCVYDNAQAHSGGLAAKFATGVTSGTNSVRWSTQHGSLSDQYGRVYVYFTANPAADVRIVTWTIVGGAGGFANLAVTSTGKVKLRSANSPQSTQDSTNSISLNQWVRIEWHVVHSTTVGQMEARIFNTPESTTPTETNTSPASWNLGTAASVVWFGVTSAAANVAAFWVDDLVGAAASYPGPYGSDAPGALRERYTPRRRVLQRM